MTSKGGWKNGYKIDILENNWNEERFDSKYIKEMKLKKAEEIAKKVLLEGFRLPSMKDAMYYHADYVNPRWGKPQITKIGRHIFYKESI